MLPSLPVEPTPIESSKLQYATPEPAITQRTLLTQSSRAWFTEPEEEHAESDVTALHQYQSLNPTFALPDSSATHIISSPYDDLSNQLDLQPLRLSARLFAVALTCLAPTRSDYATAPYQSTFNWPAVLTTLQTLCLRSGLTWKEQQFYVVIFRSKLRKGVDRVRLRQLDKRSHEEACANGGLLKYWFGNTDEGMRNLATCRFCALLQSFVLELSDDLGRGDEVS